MSTRREDLYRAYMTFFEKAEKGRRWNVFDDIPWEKLKVHRADAQLALAAETFCGVEMYLPDYVAGGLNVVRDSFGQAWFQANWGYEESKHSFALREYLLRSAARSEGDFAQFEQAIFSRTWVRPFETARRMTCYGAIQEATTLLMYGKQLQEAERLNDRVLATIYFFVRRDEAAHAAFYRQVLRLEMEEDRDGTLSDLAHVFRHFKMPGVDLVPNYDARIAHMREAGVDRYVFMREVWFRLLSQIGTSRQELARYRNLSTAPVTVSPAAE